MIGYITPACWTWPVTQHEHERASALAVSCGKRDSSLALLRVWQDGRCAAHGGRLDRLEADHDHDTGYLRGLLCHSCNMREPGAPTDSLLGRYRIRPPVAILGIRCYWARPESARYVLAMLGPDPVAALRARQAATDPARRRQP